MERSSPYDGTMAYIAANWTRYLFGYGSGVILILIITLLSSTRGWWAYVVFSLVALIILGYFLGASIWAAHQQYDTREYDQVVALSQLRAHENIVHINLGLHRTAIGLSQHLTSGRVLVLDVYNPSLVRRPFMRRARQSIGQLPADPRIAWRESGISLLPLRDDAVRVVSLCHTLSAFWQPGDRLELLREVIRILEPGGRLILLERTRNRTNWLVSGWRASSLQSSDYWRRLLTTAGFEIRRELMLNQALVTAFHVEKPVPAMARQLTLGIDDEHASVL